MKRILIDMDEVLAKYTQKVIRTLKAETGFEVDLDKVKGQFLSKSLDQLYIDSVTEYPYREGFFRDLEVMEDSQEIVRKLQEKYDVYIVSATLQHPNAPKNKLEWLAEHFPFIDYKKIVLCGDKSIIQADYLIDDHPVHLEKFKGTSIIFTAFHNLFETRYIRVDNWKQVLEIL